MITISDQTYSQWINQLSSRYRKSQIKAAIKVNREMLIFYWSLGRDIVNIKLYRPCVSIFHIHCFLLYSLCNAFVLPIYTPCW